MAMFHYMRVKQRTVGHLGDQLLFSSTDCPHVQEGEHLAMNFVSGVVPVISQAQHIAVVQFWLLSV
jgi:hypothetical protein